MKVPVPEDLKDWSLHCFCLTARATPHAVIGMDGNGRLLLEARHGISMQSLRGRGFEALESRIALLSAFGLIRRSGDEIATAFPILGPDVAARLRERSRDIAASIVDDAAKAVRAITSALKSRNLGSSTYAIVFGHVLDGLLWDRLRRRNLLPDNRLSIERPYWNGAFWAIYPGREKAGGTNEVREGGTALTLVWNDEASAALAKFAQHPSLRPLLRSLDSVSPTMSLAPLGLDQDIPVIGGGWDHAFHDACEALAALGGDNICERQDCRTLLAEAGVDVAAEEAVVIVGHEVIWAIADALMGRGVLEPPPPVSAGISPYVFVRFDPRSGH